MHKEGTNIGVLALQGGFAPHIHMLQSLGYRPREVRYAYELDLCHGLILPGGESTTIYIQAQRMNLLEPLLRFAKRAPLFGTCAGAILMAKLGILDVNVERNAYGRQIASFCEPISFQKHCFSALFIRAPIIRELGSTVEVLATHQGMPVCVQQGHHLAATFHPELTEDGTIHRYWLEQIKQNQEA